MRENELSSKTEVRKKKRRGAFDTRCVGASHSFADITAFFPERKGGGGGAAVKPSPLSARVRRRP